MTTNDTVLLPDELPPDHRSGFVATIGRPNVGKSTLTNRLIGQKIAIVSPKPQTTRNRLMGILTRPNAQVIFLDTPGIHAPQHRLGEILVEVAADTLQDADLVLWVVDVSVAPTDEDKRVAGLLDSVPPERILVALNKADKLQPEHVRENTAAYEGLAHGAPSELISATRGDNLERLLEMIVAALPLGPRFYPEEEVTDQQERFMAAELVREQVLLKLREEVPHSIAVSVEEFKPRSEEMTYIRAVIYVERDSQKLIVLGKDGSMLKQIGQAARESIQELIGTKVYLDLWVKVRPKWRSDDAELRRLGYRSPKPERR
jgi:GTP-binding protein Era